MLCLRDLAEDARRREKAGVAPEELAEIVVACKLAAAERADFTQNRLCESVANRNHHRLEAVLAQRLYRAARSSYIVNDLGTIV